MQAAERRALLLLLGLGVAGHAVRFVLTRPGEPPGEVELVKILPAQSPLAHKDSTIALARPLGAGERIDLDRAGVEDIARLPRVGPGLAKRIVADRTSRGPFGSLEGLDRVTGVGGGLLTAIADHVTFTGSPAPPSRALAPAWPGVSTAPALAAAASTSFPPETTRNAAPGKRFPVARSRRLSLNTATPAQLDSVPGIGPKRAQAIVRDRERNGPFPSVEALGRVPGIKPALLARAREWLQVP